MRVGCVLSALAETFYCNDTPASAATPPAKGGVDQLRCTPQSFVPQKRVCSERVWALVGLAGMQLRRTFETEKYDIF